MNVYKNMLKETIKNTYWYMKNGTKIKLKNMKIEHLKNCINLCERKKLNDNIRLLSCALSIKENKFDEFFEKDNLQDLTSIELEFIPEKDNLFEKYEVA